MSSTALSSIDRDAVPRITPEQLALVRNTIAQDATPDELQLFLYDCRRQGVHPLDKLIHFTKRNGKYTPITSIDFMRIRAATSGECAGIDDAVFSGTPKGADFCATVTVWRLVQGQRCAFSASARWSEYKPAANDFMWQKMPHVMLGKVAEALALRRGFPMQLSGLYAKEELDQAIDPRGGDAVHSNDAQSSSTTQQAAPAPRTITRPQQTRLFALAGQHGWDRETMRRALIAKFDVRSTAAITRDRYDEICAYFEQPPAVTPIENAPLEDQPF